MNRKRFGFRPSRHYWHDDQGANDEGFAARYCAPCERETEHEGSYCVPCWNKGKSRSAAHSQR